MSGTIQVLSGETFSSSHLSSAELFAVQIGRQDRLSSIAPDHGWANRFRLLIGIPRATPLANDHLEAIRRLVVSLRLRRKGRREAVLLAREMGLTSPKIVAVAAMLSVPLDDCLG